VLAHAWQYAQDFAAVATLIHHSLRDRSGGML
jgi:hypothetical protein